jgi:hypothetical protein
MEFEKLSRKKMFPWYDVMGGDNRQAAKYAENPCRETQRPFWIFDEPPQKPGRMLWQRWQGIIGLLKRGFQSESRTSENHVIVIQRQSHDTNTI